jgi:hypothetical protein
MYKLLRYLILTVSLSCWIDSGWGQDLTADSLATIEQPDTVDSIKTSLWPALIGSACFPGLGQIQQEHPGRAVIFYGTAVYFLYHLVWNYRQYEKTDLTSYQDNMKHYAILYAQLYALNLLDVVHEHVFRQDQPWPESMFSDQPVKSPWGAVARSAMMPGWGQVYNEQYIKAVISFGICFDFARKVYVFNQRYQQSGKESDREQRVVNTWYLGLFYTLNMVDAYVDAYLYKFDEIMDLTVVYSPVYNTTLIGVQFEF